MEILRTVGKYQLNEGDAMASGLFNVVDTELMETTEDDGVSFWFGEETKDDFMNMTDEDFIWTANEMIKDSI